MSLAVKRSIKVHVSADANCCKDTYLPSDTSNYLLSRYVSVICTVLEICLSAYMSDKTSDNVIPLDGIRSVQVNE